MAAQQYDQMLSSLEAQWQAQKNRAAAEAQAERIKLQVALQQAKDKAAAAEAQAEQAQTDTGADAWRTMLIDRNPFGAKAERGYGGGLSEYWQGAAYDTYRSALRNAIAQREAARQQNQSQVSQAETAYTLGLMEVERERQAALSELEADYNLERQNLLLQKAAAEQAERERAAASARRKRGGGKRGKTYSQAPGTQAGSGVAGAVNTIKNTEKNSQSTIDSLLRG